jgi:hypothetical protein
VHHFLQPVAFDRVGNDPQCASHVPKLFAYWSLNLEPHWCGVLEDIIVNIAVEKYGCSDQIVGRVGQREAQVATDFLCGRIKDWTSTEKQVVCHSS